MINPISFPKSCFFLCVGIPLAVGAETHFKVSQNKYSLGDSRISKASLHKLVPLRSMSHSLLEEIRAAVDDITDLNEDATAEAFYQVEQFSPPQAESETEIDLWKRVVLFSMQRDFPIRGKDGGYEISQLSQNANDHKLKEIFANTVFEDSASLFAATKAALRSDAFLIFYGSRGGSNTMDTFIAVVDLRSKEFVYLIEGNFGSDN